MNVYLGGWGGTDGGWGSVFSDYRIYRKHRNSAAGSDKSFVFLDMREDSIDMGNFADRMAGIGPIEPSQYGFYDLPVLPSPGLRLLLRRRPFGNPPMA